MSAQDHLNQDQFTKSQLNSRWQTGECGTYACALMHARPELHLGISGDSDLGGGDASEGWRPAHFYAHDDTHAYDSLGAHSLPYMGVHNQFDYAELGHTAEDWGLPEEEQDNPVSGGEALHAAHEHARKIGLIK